MSSPEDRARDPRRVAHTADSLEALGRAAGWEPVAQNPRYGNVIGKVGESRVNYTGQPHVRVLEKDSDKEIDWAAHNDAQTAMTDFIHSGQQAKGAARMVEINNSYKKANVIKIDSGK